MQSGFQALKSVLHMNGGENEIYQSVQHVFLPSYFSKEGTIYSNGVEPKLHCYGPWNCLILWLLPYVKGVGGRRGVFFSVGGVKVKECGLEQFEPCNDRGLWYGSTCQHYAPTDPPLLRTAQHVNTVICTLSLTHTCTWLGKILMHVSETVHWDGCYEFRCFRLAEINI